MAKKKPIHGFAAGTLIQMQSGFKRIERIEVGDLVASAPQDLEIQADEWPAKINHEYCRVTQVLAREASEHFRARTPYVRHKDGPLTEESYFAGADQHFYGEYTDRGYFYCGEGPHELAKGLELPWIPFHAISHRYYPVSLRLSSIELERRIKIIRPEMLYSLRVANYNSYFVGKNGLWVLGEPG